MMAEWIDRRALKARTRDLLRDAQVPPRSITALYLALLLAMNLADSFTGTGLPATFIFLLITLLSMVLEAGFVLYCMAIRRGERAEILTLFDGFSFAGKVVALGLLRTALIYLWSLLFLIPGIIAAYRYRFALYNLCENPDLSILEALGMSKHQTLGYKGQLLALDLSYLGWFLLANLPYILYTAAAYQYILQDMAALSGMLYQPASWAALAYALPAWGWSLTIDLWYLVAALFFLPAYQCVNLAYFETAKGTSGASAWGRRDGPDDLGGY